jgi:RNA polymerase sigma-70 factor (ECF subfamily)
MDRERALMRRVAQGDGRAFTDLVEAYGPKLLSVAQRLLGSRADAEDAVQRALLQSYQGARSYEPRWAVSTWLYRILTNVCVDELRRRGVRAAHAETTAEAPTGSSFEAPGDAGRRIDVERALAKVPREARVLLALHYVNGLGNAELARIRGISINTVKSQLARGKSILRAALVEGGHE